MIDNQVGNIFVVWHNFYSNLESAKCPAPKYLKAENNGYGPCKELGGTITALLMDKRIKKAEQQMRNISAFSTKQCHNEQNSLVLIFWHFWTDMKFKS